MVMDTFKKLFGTAKSRDPRMTISGTFGTMQSRKAQQKRLAEKPKSPSKPSKSVSGPSAMQKAERAALGRTLGNVGVTAKKKPMPVSSVSSKKAPAKKKAMDSGLAARKVLGSGPNGLSEDNAVMRRLKQRAMERAVKKVKGK